MSQVQDLFREHTNVDGDYFLMEILKILGVVEDEDLSIPHSDSIIYFHNQENAFIGSCKVTKGKLVIEKYCYE